MVRRVRFARLIPEGYPLTFEHWRDAVDLEPAQGAVRSVHAGAACASRPRAVGDRGADSRANASGRTESWVDRHWSISKTSPVRLHGPQCGAHEDC